MMSDKGGLMKQKRILVLGATGAMGQYLVPLLSRQDSAWTASRSM